MASESGHRFLLAGVPDLRRRLERRTIKDVIVDNLAALIASGGLRAGDDLPAERELSAALGVSRETVRGALQELAARGIVEIAQGMRTRIVSTDPGALGVSIARRTPLNSYDIEDVHAARLLVERQVIGDAALRIGAEALTRLDYSLEAQRNCLADPVRFLICDRDFHVTIYRQCGNALLADMVTDLYTYMMDFRRRAISQPGAIPASYADHLAIAAALAAHDGAMALHAFSEHTERIYLTTLPLLAGLSPLAEQ